MKKIIFAILGILVVSLVLVSCSSGKAISDEELEEELSKLTNQQLDLLIEDDGNDAIAGQAFLTSPKLRTADTDYRRISNAALRVKYIRAKSAGGTINSPSGLALYCNDDNNDGIYDSCKIGGTGRPCESFEECQTKNGCLNNACVPGGAGKNCKEDKECLGNEDIGKIDPVTCEDTDGDGLFDSCTERLTSAFYCNSDEDCLDRLGCNNNQCVQGGVYGTCQSDVDCFPTEETDYCPREGVCADGTKVSCFEVDGICRCDPCS